MWETSKKKQRQAENFAVTLSLSCTASQNLSQLLNSCHYKYVDVEVGQGSTPDNGAWRQGLISVTSPNQVPIIVSLSCNGHGLTRDNVIILEQRMMALNPSSGYAPFSNLQDGSESSLPIFNVERVQLQFNIAADFVAAQVANNVLILGLATGRILRIDLDNPADIDGRHHS